MRRSVVPGARRAMTAISGFRGARRVPGALGLATLALGVLSIQAVRREAVTRRSLVVDAHRGVADLVSARLSAGLADDERAITAAVETSEGRAEPIVEALAKVEAERPWLGCVSELCLGASVGAWPERPITGRSVDQRPLIRPIV